MGSRSNQEIRRMDEDRRVTIKEKIMQKECKHYSCDLEIKPPMRDPMGKSFPAKITIECKHCNMKVHYYPRYGS